jgi:hypothetical protein
MSERTAFLLLSLSWSDLDATGEFLKKIPPRFLQEDAFASQIAQLWLWKGEGDRAMDVLDKVPHDFLSEFGADEPKGYLLGWATASRAARRPRRRSGRTPLPSWRPDWPRTRETFRCLALKASLQALLGLKADARETWKLRRELGGISVPIIDDEVRIHALLGDSEAAAILVRRWPQLPPRGGSVPPTRAAPHRGTGRRNGGLAPPGGGWKILKGGPQAPPESLCPLICRRFGTSAPTRGLCGTSP